MIEAVVFDCFGVLATDGWLPFRERYFSHDPELLERATVSNKKVDAGLHHYDDFIDEVAAMAGLTATEARQQIENNVPNAKLFDYIRQELKPHYKLGFLSNAGQNWLQDIFTSEQIALFDAVVLSFEIGAIKPDPITYETVAEKLGVAPEACVFVDDQPRYCEGAEAVGMQAILYQDAAQTISDLDKALHA